MKTFILAIAAILMTTLYCQPVSAAEFVTTYRSHHGETMDAFATRISMDAHKRSSRGEICGEFYRDGDVLVLDTYTINKYLECSYMRSNGHEYTGITFHTHVKLKRFSPEDYESFPGYMTTGDLLLFQHGRHTVRRVSSR
jgi:hypothetical protein